MSGIIELSTLLSNMHPELSELEYVFCTVQSNIASISQLEPLCIFKEDEGLTLVMEKTIAEAEGYAEAQVNRAEGDADRFLATVKEYRRAPRITRERIYLETMEKLFQRMEKLTIVDSKIKGLLPIFDTAAKLEKVSKP